MPPLPSNAGFHLSCAPLGRSHQSLNLFRNLVRPMHALKNHRLRSMRLHQHPANAQNRVQRPTLDDGSLDLFQSNFLQPATIQAGRLDQPAVVNR